MLSDQFISRDEAIQLWIYIIRYGLADVLQAPSIPPLKAEACAALATVGSQIFECLPVCFFLSTNLNPHFFKIIRFSEN